MSKTLNELIDKNYSTKHFNDIDNIINEVNETLLSDFSYMVNLLIKHGIHKSWYKLFLGTYKKLVPILKKIDEIRNDGINIFPPSNDVFKVFRKNIDDIKIVLLGQDPYPKKGHAMGLAFSVNKEIVMAMSVFNIFKELKAEYPERKYNFTHGDLTAWSDRGMFLLNSALTVIEGKPNSQQSMWTWFTDLCIEYICCANPSVVFLLFGANAISKSNIIKKNISNSKIVTCTHPSPMSAHNGFFNSNVFKKVDALLEKPFDWSIYQ
jgi:uracil-DNA glycosylase